jgi:hypothetical protein
MREKERKCTGMEQVSGFLLIGRPGRKLDVLFHEQSDKFSSSSGKGKVYLTTYRFEDVSEDGYPDLLFSRTSPASSSTTDAVRSVHSVRCYDEDRRRWGKRAYEGFVLGQGRVDACDIPVPGRPYAVVAALHPERRFDDKIVALSEKLRGSGFPNVCVYRADALGGFSATTFVTIVSTHASRVDAERDKRKLRNAGFSPFVKTLFKK